MCGRSRDDNIRLFFHLDETIALKDLELYFEIY